MQGLPTESEILENLNSKEGGELHDYLTKLTGIAKKSDPKAYIALFEILNRSLEDSIKHPLHFKVPEEASSIMKEIETFVQNKLAEVVELLQESIEEAAPSDMTNLNEENSKREISSDGLCGFLEFPEGEQDQGVEGSSSTNLPRPASIQPKISFKLNKKIMVEGQSQITCLHNIGNRLLAAGCRSGTISIYRVANSELLT